MKFTKVIQTCLLVTITALVVAGIYTSGVIRERQQALDKILRYNVAYDSSQAAIEFARLQMSLMQFDRAPTQANLDDAKLRFDILVNRFEVFSNGEFLRFIDMDPEHRRIFNIFKGVIAAVDPIMTSADVRLDADKPLALLEPLGKELIGFSSQANRFVAALAAGDHAKLVRLHWQFSSLTFGLMIYFYRAIGREPPVWSLDPWAWTVAAVAMWIGAVLFVGSFLGNPALPGARLERRKAPAGVFAITRHPMMWGFAIWATVHLAVIGTAKAMVFDGAILFLAIVGSIGQDAKKAKLMGERFHEWAAQTAFVPFGRGAAWPGMAAFVGGTVLFLLATWLHPIPVGIWSWIG